MRPGAVVVPIDRNVWATVEREGTTINGWQMSVEEAYLVLAVVPATEWAMGETLVMGPNSTGWALSSHLRELWR